MGSCEGKEAKKGEDTRARVKLRREVAFSTIIPSPSLLLETSPSRRRNFALLPSPFFACIHVVRYRLNIMLTVKVASAAEDEL